MLDQEIYAILHFPKTQIYYLFTIIYVNIF